MILNGSVPPKTKNAINSVGIALKTAKKINSPNLLVQRIVNIETGLVSSVPICPEYIHCARVSSIPSEN